MPVDCKLEGEDTLENICESIDRTVQLTRRQTNSSNIQLKIKPCAFHLEHTEVIPSEMKQPLRNLIEFCQASMERTISFLTADEPLISTKPAFAVYEGYVAVLKNVFEEIELSVPSEARAEEHEKSEEIEESPCSKDDNSPQDFTSEEPKEPKNPLLSINALLNGSAKESTPHSKKKKRTSLDKETRRFLEQVFEKKKRPNAKEREIIARKCNLDPIQIRVWFTNKRMRSK